LIDFIAFDLDGTLVGRDNVVRPAVRAAVERVRMRGITGGIVTGRMYQASLPFARSLDLLAPLVCYQGAAIIDPQSDDVLLDVPLQNAVALKVVEFACRDGLHVQLYRNDMYYCESRNRFSDLYAHVSGVEPIIVASLKAEFASSDATKAVMIADPDVAARASEALATHLGNRAYVTRSYPEFVEVLDPKVDKGEALRFIAARLSLDLDRVMAIGDSWNDEPLLRVAGVKIAMGSAPESLKNIADAVVGDLEHDGVAAALERYIPA
jgi:Cof subfamily protein (haloacid dehalogenase superfamily)